MVRMLLLVAVFGGIFLRADDSYDQKDKIHSSIPVVDFQDYFINEKRDQFIEDVRQALHTVGFFAVVNTKVNRQLVSNLYRDMTGFFALPKDQKMLVEGSKSECQRGYVAFGKSAAKGSSTVDYKETFCMGKQISYEQSQQLGVWQNIWPDFYNLKDPSLEFYNHIWDYALVFQEIFSLALGEDKNFLKDYCKGGDTSCRVIHYPVNKNELEGDERTVWAGAHTDVNLFTILPKATGDGLEVLDEAGNWLPVVVDEDAFIINAGDFLEIFSNGFFKSSIHRVLQPKNMTKDRYSSVMFVHPKSYQMMYPLPYWIEKTGGKKKFIEATRQEMLMERLADMGIATDKALKDLSDSLLLERLMTVGKASKEAMQAVFDAGYATEIVKAKLQEK